MDFKEKVAVVTGSARGIGYAIAHNLAQKGATVVVSDLDQDASEKAASAIAQETGAKLIGIKANVADFEDVQKLMDKTKEELGRIDILVNNAGITKDNLLLRMTAEDWKKVIDVNLNSVFNCTKAAIRTMLKQKYGRIVNVASVIGLMGNAGQANYAASKAGIIAFTKSVAKEFGSKSITCNAVAPGFIQTEMTASLPKEYLDNIISALPLKRLGEVKDVANLVAFLASDMASYITGQVITVAGGMVM
jgi:3-oxoacyl-[acyl-carrier protein] reductase